jgi:Protein of unknown function (DUF3185)
MRKIIGVASLVGGVLFLVRGHDIAQSVDSQVKQIFTGSPTDQATYYYLAGAVLGLFGLFQIFRPKPLK